MERKHLYLSDEDMATLREVIGDARRSGYEPREDLNKLEEELTSMKVIAEQQVPRDVVTMNSQVRLKNLDSGDEFELALVFPEQADLDQDRISVLAPLGMAVLGRKVGEVFDWVIPSGRHHYRVEEILSQPNLNLGKSNKD
jgi:regulator of nucleoside diphosphate kinase